MNGLETAIRNALERSDRSNAETRARIYQSARQALESGLRKQNINDVETVNYQRRKLETLIHEVELEERARLDMAVSPPDVAPSSTPAQAGDAAPTVSTHMHTPAPAPTQARTPVSAQGSRAEPAFATSPASAGSAGATDRDVDRDVDRDPVFDDDDLYASSRDEREQSSDADGPMPDMRSEAPLRKPRRRRGFFSRLFILAILLAGAGTAAWWVYSSDLLLTDAERDTSVPNPPPRAEEEDFNGPESAPQAPQGPQALDSRGGFSDDWIDVFEPQQIAAIRPRANGMVDVVTASDGTAVRLGSRSGDADGAIEITVPADVLRELAGRTSTIALTLQSADDKPVQISVDCDFSRLGACPRHRFTINPQKLDALFRVSFDSGMAPASAGRLVVNADLSGGGRGVNLYSVRILPGQ
ncbi:hypothetical protein PDO_0632 [Rhizobium sp. PDO1-076]|uniref:hypothetical protein n=1 Tax=Rhizobium sp. PDO1-076 TaxID=1125979 RepID=UPI00024E29F8|nr:hypothetical protein [Rhizobium sp. PDO1-076]EHS49254.1 hypothetical protein PDO_0632 [Rhizobium sp. PDO1-076]